jgi:hypothetical protein
MFPTSIHFRRPDFKRGIVLCAVFIAFSNSVADARTFRLPFSFASQTPHPAVVRISVAEKGATSHGTGTLVNVAGQHGLIVTNWHVVRDAAGEIVVEFPDGFRSAARVLNVDRDWDLAALQIWRPRTQPVPLATVAPHPGDTLAIAGYGSGQYRTVTGRCTQYVAPGANFPFEMVELSAEARQGDSGGPIFNERGELAGVLFGAGHGTTSGSYCGRVGTFLATVLSGVESIHLANPVPARAGTTPSRGTRTVIERGPTLTQGPSFGANVAPLVPTGNPVPPSIPETADTSVFSSLDPYFGSSPRIVPSTDLRPLTDASSLTAPVYQDGTQLGHSAWRDSDDDQPISSPATSASAPWNDLVGTTPFEHGKSILAGIGILALMLRLTNVLAGNRN